jgi:hypothetical protein
MSLALLYPGGQFVRDVTARAFCKLRDQLG